MGWSYISVITVNPEDWESTLSSADTLPAVLTNDPSGTSTPVYSGLGMNATNSELFYMSDEGPPADGTYSVVMIVDTFDDDVPHRATWLWVGTIINGETFRYSNTAGYPIITVQY